jgi:hypothetical protein
MTDTLTTENLTPALIAQNIGILIGLLESGTIKRGRQVLIQKPEADGEEPRYCCLGVGCWKAGLQEDRVNWQFISLDDGESHETMPPTSTDYAMGLVLEDPGEYEGLEVPFLCNRHLPGYEPSVADSHGADDFVVNTLAVLNDKSEQDEHWETGKVIAHFKLVEHYWQMRASNSPRLLLDRCSQCGKSGDWIERYESVNRYNTITISFTDDGQVDQVDEVIGGNQSDQTETIELRCTHCLSSITTEQALTLEELMG